MGKQNKKVLGRGLDALFSENSPISGKNIELIGVHKILPNPDQPRKTFNEEKLMSLSKTIARDGIISPIIVIKKNDKYIIVAGERRYRAAKLANLNEIPCIIKELHDDDIMLYSLLENIQREDLNSIERADAIFNLMNKTGLTHEKLGELLGYSRVYVTNTLRLLKLPQVVKGLIVSGKLSEGHGRTLAVLDEAKALKYAKFAIEKSLSVRQLEDLLKNKPSSKKRTKSKIKKDPNIIKIEKDIQDKLSREVEIKTNKHYKGEIRLKFYDLDDLNNLINTIKKLHN
ncbi:ParB/RepB/Spo0J family partition protein [bacterium]|nr:ParB/RepB/Spo0J family partition protein [bacterium]